LHGVPDGFHIIPGMPVTADVKVGKRTVLKYLLGMMLPVTREAMREPWPPSVAVVHNGLEA
jgi:hemolysin D